jgi:DNA repair and recombination protein RAD52
MFTAEQIAKLEAPLDRAHVATRSQSGRILSYIEGWHAIAEANRIFGFDGWFRETVEMRLVAERERTVGQGTGWGVSYLCKVRVVVFAPGCGDGIAREGYGTGHGIDRDLGLAHESATKEAETDAMKRALMTFGNPFGLALYDKTQAHVADAPPPPPAKPRKTPAEWADGEMVRIDAMAKAGDVEGITNWPAAEAKAIAHLLTKAPDAHAMLMRFHADTLARHRAAQFA